MEYLQWHFEYGGDKYEFILANYDQLVAQRNGHMPELPYSIAERPELFLHLTLVWIMFTLLRNCRQVSEFGIGAISLTDMRSILDEFEIADSDVRLEAIQLLQALDAVYIEHLAKQIRAQQPPAPHER